MVTLQIEWEMSTLGKSAYPILHLVGADPEPESPFQSDDLHPQPAAGGRFEALNPLQRILVRLASSIVIILHLHIQDAMTTHRQILE